MADDVFVATISPPSTVKSPPTPTVVSKVAASATLNVPLTVVAVLVAPMSTAPPPTVVLPVVVAKTFMADDIFVATISPPSTVKSPATPRVVLTVAAPVTAKVEPLNVKFALSSTAPEVPARTTLPSVKSEIVADARVDLSVAFNTLKFNVAKLYPTAVVSTVPVGWTVKPLNKLYSPNAL